MPSKSSRTTALIVACAMFMEHLDGSIIATALPQMARSLQTDPLHLNLAITSYLFSLALFIPLSGWMSDRFGSRTVFRSAILLFTLSSLACSAAQSLSFLVIARLFQGLAGAMMVPVGRVVLLRTTEKAELLSAINWLTAPALLGPVIGPPLGGFIVTHWSWHWIFLINLPIGLLGLYLVNKHIPQLKAEQLQPLDKKGFALMAFALSGLVIGFETAGRELIETRFVGGAIVAGTIGLVLYALHARKHEAPIIDLTLFKNLIFRVNVLGGAFYRLGVGALPFLLPLFFQIAFGYSPLHAGMLAFASSAGTVMMKLVAKPLIRRFGFRTILLHNGWASSLAIGCYAFFDPSMGSILMASILFFVGFARSIEFTILNSLAYDEIEQERLSNAATLATMMQQVSLSAGVALGALVLNLTLQGRTGESLTRPDFLIVFWVVALLSACSALWFRLLPPHVGAEMSGKAEA